MNTSKKPLGSMHIKPCKQKSSLATASTLSWLMLYIVNVIVCTGVNQTNHLVYRYSEL